MRLPFSRHSGGRLGWSLSRSALRTVDRSLTTIITRTDELATATFVMTKAMLDQETGTRGYLLTGAALFLQPYRAGQAAYPAAYARAERLARDPVARALLRQMQVRAQAWHAWIVPRLRDVQSGRRAAVTAEATEEGKRRFDAVRAAAHALLAHLQEESRQALACSRDAVTRARGLGMLVFFGTVALGVLLAWRLSRSIPHGAPALCLIRAAQGSVPMPTLTRHDSL